METKKVVNKGKKENQPITKKKVKKSCECKSFPLAFSAGFFVMGIITIVLISLLITPLTKKDTFNSEEITAKIENLINANLMSPGSKIEIKEKATKSHNLYKTIIDPGNGQELDIYMTEDEEIIFTQAWNIEEEKAKKAGEESAAPTDQNKNLVKSDNPIVELFVMSHCPYGTQIEKGILPVVETLGDKIDFEIKFCDYAMHGETELDEQLQQHCIKTEEPTKFTNYLKCFLEDGDSKRCITETNINTSKLNSCIATTDKEFSVSANFKDKSTWKGSYPTFNLYKEDNAKYGVGGSPTLVINGTTMSSSRDSKSLLATVCSAFETPPEECSTELSSAAPSPGFGSATTTGSTEASCN